MREQERKRKSAVWKKKISLGFLATVVMVEDTMMMRLLDVGGG